MSVLIRRDRSHSPPGSEGGIASDLQAVLEAIRQSEVRLQGGITTTNTLLATLVTRMGSVETRMQTAEGRMDRMEEEIRNVRQRGSAASPAASDMETDASPNPYSRRYVPPPSKRAMMIYEGWPQDTHKSVVEALINEFDQAYQETVSEVFTPGKRPSVGFAKLTSTTAKWKGMNEHKGQKLSPRAAPDLKIWFAVGKSTAERALSKQIAAGLKAIRQVLLTNGQATSEEEAPRQLDADWRSGIVW